LPAPFTTRHYTHIDLLRLTTPQIGPRTASPK
jgi:hypothetical protein